MVTFLELRDAQPTRLGAAADEWLRMAEKLARLETRVVNELTKPLRNSGWAGESADIAFRSFDRLDDELELAARQTRNLATVIRFARTEFVKVQEQLRAVLGAVRRDGLQVDDRGAVQPPSGYVSESLDPIGYQRYRQLIANARAYTDQITTLVRRASQLDGDCARVLMRFEPYSPGRMASGEWRDATGDARSALNLMGMTERNIPAAGSAPQANRAWWDGLSEEHRSLYLAAHPDRVGALDGLPAQQRHDANQMAMRNLIEMRSAADGPTERLTTLLDRLEASEYGPQAQRLYLLGIDNRLDGLGVVSVGNPDTARHLGVAVVPGITVTLDDMNGQIDRAGALRQTADDLTPDVEGDVAVVAWVGYDTPGVVTSPAHGYADTAAPVLDRFVDGTQVAQEAEGTQSHRTVVGHSYGSSVVGLAASQGNGLAVHDIIVAGSPGMRVPDATHLNIDPRHVWAGRASDDPIPVIGPISHGPAPHTEAFGANRFHVDTSGHVDYWRPGSESLRNQAHILVGQYDRVTLDHGRPPR
ncbi:MAG TPA: alpha/beta hydrolase [Candidatus Limnocylindrales bacterium]